MDDNRFLALEKKLRNKILHAARSLTYSNQDIVEFLGGIAFAGGDIDKAIGGLNMANQSGESITFAFNIARQLSQLDEDNN